MRDMPRALSAGLGMALWIALAIGLSACDSATSPTPDASVLSVFNAGSRSLDGLVILFPDDRVEFGDIAAGVTTPYRLVGHGVYSYAAYEFRVGGRVQSQPVTDWVGEQPLEGRAFTYSLALVEEASLRLSIRLVSTRRDD